VTGSVATVPRLRPDGPLRPDGLLWRRPRPDRRRLVHRPPSLHDGSPPDRRRRRAGL